MSAIVIAGELFVAAEALGEGDRLALRASTTLLGGTSSGVKLHTPVMGDPTYLPNRPIPGLLYVEVERPLLPVPQPSRLGR